MLPRSESGLLHIGGASPVAPWTEMTMSARIPARGGLGVECQEAKRHGGSRRSQALEEVHSFGPWWTQGAVQRSRTRASIGLWRYTPWSGPRRLPQPARQAQL